MNILAIALLVVILAIIGAYLVWVMWAGYHRQWRRLAILVTLPIAMVLLFMAWRAWEEYTYKNEKWAAIFGPGIERPNPIISESYGPAAGDYMSIEFYKIPKAMRTRFQTASEKELREIFQLQMKDPDVRTVPWRRTPFDPAMAPYLDAALALEKDIRDYKCRLLFSELRPALESPGSYYALWHDQRGQRSTAVGLFVVSPGRELVCVINFWY